MIATFHALVATLLFGCSRNVMSMSNEKSRTAARNYQLEFVQAMGEVERQRDERNRKSSLMERLLKLAKRVDGEEILKESHQQRRLGNNNNRNYNYYNGNNYGSSASGNLSGLAIKYTGCQNIKRWDDSLAATGAEAPLAMDRFVMFRLCKAEDCSAYHNLGCSSDNDYGEYMLPMEQYLELMADYHFAQFSRYCRTCYHCMKLDYYQEDTETNDGEGAEQGDNSTTTADASAAAAAAAAEEDADTIKYESFNFGTDDWAGYNRYWGNGGNRRQRRDAENYYYNEGKGAANYYYGDKGYDFNYGQNDNYYNKNRYWYESQDTGRCIFETVCHNYRSACKEFNPNATFYESYFRCSQFAVGNSAVYLAPHCRADGHSIGIGIYSNSQCSNFIGDEVDISKFTGQAFNDEELKSYYDKTCLSCSAVDAYSLVSDEQVNSVQQFTYPLCTALYETSAKCNLYAGDMLQYNAQETNQEKNEQNVCDFIDGLHSQSYNEFGTIVLRSKGNLATILGTKGAKGGGFLSEATTGQEITLVFSVIVFIVMTFYAGYLTKKLYYRKAWRPPKSVHAPFSSGATVSGTAYAVSRAGQMSRANSGIMAVRSGRSAESASSFQWWTAGSKDNLNTNTSTIESGHYA